MRTIIHPVGSLVLITSFGPYGGCIGTVRYVDVIHSDGNEPVPFYLIDLHDIQMKEPLWFEHDVVIAVQGNSATSLAQNEEEVVLEVC